MPDYVFNKRTRRFESNGKVIEPKIVGRLNVTPVLAAYNVEYLRDTDAKSSCQGWGFELVTMIQSATFLNILFVKFGCGILRAPPNKFGVFTKSTAVSRRRESEPRSMLRVSEGRCVFQVAQAVVVLYAVKVVDYIIRRASSYKSSGDQCVNVLRFGLAASAKRNAGVPSVGRFKDSANATESGSRGLHVSSYTTKIRHAINPPIPNNGTPLFRGNFFCGKLLFSHDAFAPSIESGLVRAALGTLTPSRLAYL